MSNLQDYVIQIEEGQSSRDHHSKNYTNYNDNIILSPIVATKTKITKIEAPTSGGGGGGGGVLVVASTPIATTSSTSRIGKPTETLSENFDIGIIAAQSSPLPPPTPPPQLPLTAPLITPFKLLTNNSRRTSTSSQQSLPSCTSPTTYDSGNFSCSNTSDFSILPIGSSSGIGGDSSAEDESSSDFCLPEFNFNELTDDVKKLQRDLREKDQLLLLAVTDARKMKGELERLVKSERWYKNELKNQKRSRLEILEKLYLNERKFIEENQKLKTDCANLYSVCNDIEKKSLNEKDYLVKQLQELQRLYESTKFIDGTSSSQSIFDNLKFELQKQREVICEKESLIEVLKKQKQNLLKDLNALTAQRDSKISNLESSTFTLEQENRKITKKCAILFEEKRNYEEELRQHEKLLDDTKIILQQRELDLINLQAKYQDQLKEIQCRANDIATLKCRLNELESQRQVDDINCIEKSQLLTTYHREIDKKTEEIEQLKSLRRVENDKISQLQLEISNLQDFRERYENAKYEIEQLKFQLQGKDFEIENLQLFQANQTKQIVELQEKLIEYQKLRENFDKYVQLLQANNEILEERQNEIDRLKGANEELLKDLSQLHKDYDKRDELLSQKDDDLIEKQQQIDMFYGKFEQQTEEIKNLCGKLENLQNLQDILHTCQNELELTKTSLTLKDDEIVNLKNFIDNQSKKLLEFDRVVQENVKFYKDIENLNKELAERSEELMKLQNITMSVMEQKNEAVIKLENNSTEKMDKLHEIIKEKISQLNSRDMEIETLRLILKGQKAQIKRFNCKCAENAELREKFKEANQLLKMDKRIFETEAAELDFLRKIAQHQAMEIDQLTEEKDNKQFNRNISISSNGSNSSNSNNSNESEDSSIDKNIKEKFSQFEKYLEDNDLLGVGAHDLEAKAHRIEILKSLLDKKSDKIIQLNLETDRWLELLKNLRFSKSKSRDRKSNSQNLCNENDDKTDEIVKNEESLEQLNEKKEEIENDAKGNINGHDNEIEHKSCIHDRKSEISDNLSFMESIEKESDDDFMKTNEIFDNNLENLKNENISLRTMSLPNSWKNFENQIIIHPPKDRGEFCTSLKIINRVPENNNNNNSLSPSRNRDDDDDATTGDDNIDSDWKLMRNVIEFEHRRKISRYELHMRTLLGNIKIYKKKLEIMESKEQKLLEKCKQLEEDLKEAEHEKEMMKISYESEIEKMMTSKFQKIQDEYKNCCKNLQESFFNAQQQQELSEISDKYEKSQKIIVLLKNQLETARKQFLEMEDYKRLSVEFKYNLGNFVDDYTKLLSPLDSYKNSIATDEIYDLISRSNNFVPNFDNLQNSLDALKSDIKRYSPCTAALIVDNSSNNNNNNNNRFSSSTRKMSLMDELKAADPYCYS